MLCCTSRSATGNYQLLDNKGEYWVKYNLHRLCNWFQKCNIYDLKCQWAFTIIVSICRVQFARATVDRIFAIMGEVRSWPRVGQPGVVAHIWSQHARSANRINSDEIWAVKLVFIRYNVAVMIWVRLWQLPSIDETWSFPMSKANWKKSNHDKNN